VAVSKNKLFARTSLMDNPYIAYISLLYSSKNLIFFKCFNFTFYKNNTQVCKTFHLF